MHRLGTTRWTWRDTALLIISAATLILGLEHPAAAQSASPIAAGSPVSAQTRPAAPGAVRVWQDTITLPTYEEEPPNVNPPFDLFSPGRPNYPYTIRENLTPRRSPHVWRALNLENEYLKLVVLPDLGGHIYRCLDKTNGAEMFYANPSIKLAKIGYRGAWAALGVEFNFPVSHNWASTSPVDFALQSHADGSASIWVGNIDRPYGMQWRVELVLRPGQSVLAESIWLYNRSDVRHRFYWWNNAAVRVWDDSRIILPTRFTAAHGFASVEPWPVDWRGRDLSLVGNQKDMSVSTFIHGSREPYLGVYHAHTKAGVIHYSAPEDAPAKKIFCWGMGSLGVSWSEALSDDNSFYVELQAGLFRNQETYAFLEPQQTLHFHEYWLPVRDIGGVSRANLNGAVNIERGRATVGAGAVAGAVLKVGVNLTRTIAGGTLRIKQGEKVVSEQPLNAGPDKPAFAEIPIDAKAGPFTVLVLDAAKQVLVEHTEGKYDWEPENQITVGSQAGHRFPPEGKATEGDLLEQGEQEELVGDPLGAWKTYTAAKARFPDSLALHKALGRLAVGLKRYDEAVPLLTKAVARNTPDPETRYYLGLAWVGSGHDERARNEFEAAQLLPAFAGAAHFELGRLAARNGDRIEALRQIDLALAFSPQMTRAGAMRVALLRVQGQIDQARAAWVYWREADPMSGLLRCEEEQLNGAAKGDGAGAIWAHLAGDPERIIEVAVDYMELGLYSDALALLSRDYPTQGVVGEPGAIRPADYPLIAYYRGYCRGMTGGDGAADFTAAAAMPTKYVFPNRPLTGRVLRKALEVNPKDATAKFFLGSLALSGGDVDGAIARWHEALALNPAIPTLHQSLASTLLFGKDQPEEALKVLRDGLAVDKTNTDLYVSVDRVMSLIGKPAADRAAILRSYPDPAAMPPLLVYALATALVEAGQAQEASDLFAGRYFPAEENGVDVREIYIEVQLQLALSLAKQGKVEQAQAVADKMTKPVAGLAFTAKGMGRYTDKARFQVLWGDVMSQCGKADAAREHWQAAAAARDREQPWLMLAGARIGEAPDAAAMRQQWQTTLDRTDSENGRWRMIASRLWLLRALGRDAEAKAAFADGLKMPNRGLRYYFMREAMRLDTAIRP